MADGQFDMSNAGAAGAAFNPILWSKDVIRARLADLVIYTRVMNRMAELTKGQTLRVPLISALTAKTLGTDGAYVAQYVAETYSDLVINQKSEVTIQLLDQLETFSAYDLRKLYAPMIGHAMGKVVDTYLWGIMYTAAATSYAETAQDDIDQAMILSAIKALDNYEVPQDMRYMGLCPTQYDKLLGDAVFNRADILGTGSSATLTGKLPGLYGMEVLKTTQVPTNTTRSNMIWHKSSTACGLAKKVNMKEKDVSGKTATDIVSWEYYGGTVERANHIRVLPTNNA